MSTQLVKPLGPDDVVTDSLMGFSVEKKARKVIIAFLCLAFVIIGLGATAALLMVYTRAPSIMLLKPKWYYMTLTYHGILMLTMFPHLFEVGLMFFGVTGLLHYRLASTKAAWVGFWFVLVGILTVLLTIAGGDASVMYTMYVPLRANGFFYIGHFLYAIGLFIEMGVWAMTVALWKNENHGKSLPLATFGMGVMAILLTVSLISAVVAFLPATLWAFRIWIDSVDPMVFKAAFWGMGHTLQYINNVGLIVAWYMVTAYAHRSKSTSEKFSRMAFALYCFTAVPVFGHHLIVDPTFSPVYKYVGATAFGFALGIPSMMHGYAVPASVEANIRARARARGEKVTAFSFLKHWGWNIPSAVMLAWSVAAFGLGGFDGTMATTVPLNMQFHNTFFIVAHFHGTLAAGMAISYMALAYYFLPSLGIDVVWKKLAYFQAWWTSVGFFTLIVTMHWGAELGVPRRIQSIWYAHAGAPIPHWITAMNFLPVGGTMAATGVLLFVTIMLASIIKGKKLPANAGKVGVYGEPWAEADTAPSMGD